MTNSKVNGSGDCTILKAVWGMIWDPASEFYLPKVARNGLTDPNLGIDIKPFDSFSIPDIPTITMFDEPVLGYMKIRLSDSSVSGVSTVNGSNFSCNDSSSSQTTFSFDFSFSALNLLGSYTVSAGGGIGGCAIAATAAILGGKATTDAVGGGLLAASDPAQQQSDLALWYQKPLGESANGQALIGAYYDNQDGILDLQNENGGQNAYTQSLSASDVHSTTGGVYAATDYYRKQLSGQLSAELQAAPAPTIGSDDQYNSGQLPYAYLIAMARRKVRNNQDPDGRFAKLAEDATNFIGSIAWYHTTYPGEQPIGGNGGVLDRIANADPEQVRAFVQSKAAIDFLNASVVGQLDERVKSDLSACTAGKLDLERWHGVYQQRFAVASSSDVDGTYNDNNMNISGSLAGTLRTVGGTLQVSITSMSAIVNSVTIHLEQTAGWWPGLYNKVVNWIANDTFIHGEIKKGLSNGLSSETMKSNLENLLNGALKSL